MYYSRSNHTAPRRGLLLFVKKYFVSPHNIILVLKLSSRSIELQSDHPWTPLISTLYISLTNGPYMMRAMISSITFGERYRIWHLNSFWNFRIFLKIMQNFEAIMKQFEEISKNFWRILWTYLHNYTLKLTFFTL